MTTSTDNDASPSHRDPIPNAGIRIILLTELPIEHAKPIVKSIADRIEALGRPVESRIIPVAGVSLGTALSQGRPSTAVRRRSTIARSCVGMS
jgi:hypothetical protein